MSLLCSTMMAPGNAASPPEGWTLFTLDREFIPGLKCARQYTVLIGQFMSLIAASTPEVQAQWARIRGRPWLTPAECDELRQRPPIR